MADNITAPATGSVLATDDINGVHYLRAKIALGADGAAADTVGGAGAVAPGVQRVTLASDDPAVAALQTLVGTEYETVAPSSTNQPLGSTGAAGDLLASLLVIPASTSPGAVQIKDGADSAITVFAGGTDSVSTLHPFAIPLGIRSGAGAWQVTTGANVSVIASFATFAEGSLSSFAAVQTSTPGTSPYSFTGTMGADIFPGYFLNIQRSTAQAKDGNGDYVTITQQVQHPLTMAEKDAGFISQAALEADGWTQPTGLFYEQYWWSNDGGQEGPRTELTDDIAAFTATFDPLNKNSGVTLSELNREMTEQTGGGLFPRAAVGNTALSNPTGYVEFTLEARNLAGGEPVSAGVGIGVVNESFTVSGSSTPGNSTNSVGLLTSTTGTIHCRDEGVYNGTFDSSGGVVGSTFGFFVHLASRRVWFRKQDGAWLGGTPVINSDGTVNAASTGGMVLDTGTTLKFAAAGNGFGTLWRVNAGQEAFVHGPPTNGEPGWA